MPVSNCTITAFPAGDGSPPSGGTRRRILSAAADLLKSYPNDFSVQRVARQSGFSARSVYAHFSSGSELAVHARLLTLQQLIGELPIEVCTRTTPFDALQQFALGICSAIRTVGPEWLMASRKDAWFRTEYRQTVRGRLVSQMEQFLLGIDQRDQIQGMSCGGLAELFVTAIESLTINHEPDLILEVQLADSIEWTVRSFIQMNGLFNLAPFDGPTSEAGQMACS